MEYGATLSGVSHFYFATGTEGGYWAFQNEIFIQKDEKGEDTWSYAGLHILHNGDVFSIYDTKDSSKIIWKGTIDMEEFPPFTESAFGLWIHTEQKNISRTKWAEWFLKEYPAKLKLGKISIDLLKKIPRSH